MGFDRKILGKRIAARRKQSGLKQNVPAERLDISNNHMSGIENGKENPSLDLLLRICAELNVTPDYLLLGNLHAGNVPKNVIDILENCDEDDLAVIREVAERFLLLRNGSGDSDKTK